ncbi:PREDICTED: endothelin-converting enzyme 1-like [Ceratosolen solmsi marchali]|uniref:Endothelin-converting enzyme 1-like n=1 Tax=Ceratosolen solmsi marchali TaxID=326594 RepID=A0AAJ7DZF1_9HYME|nr:PREDICTED: endothelin-converting enzyme 1-like [Ceratosolen solmsi marchali]
MNLMMLRQLLWICIVPIFKATANYVVQPDFDECDRSQCTPIDEIFKSNIDSKAEPCDDFFRYACGKNFTRHTTLGIDLSDILLYNSENNDLADLKKILGEPFLSVSDSNIDALKVEREIYERCQKGTHSHQEKVHYEKLLVKYKANRLNQNYNYDPNDNEPWSRTDLKYALGGFGFAFFDIDIIQRDHLYTGEPKRYIQISPTSDNVLDMNDLLTSKYMNMPERTAYRDVHSGYNYNNNHNHDNKYLQLKHFIDELNKIVPYEKYDSSKSEKPPEPRLLLEWQKKYNELAYDSLSKIDWLNLLKEFFAKMHIEINEYESILIKDESYFFHLAETLRSTHNFNTIVDYIHLRFVSKTIGFVEKEYQEKYSIIPSVKGLICTPGLLVGAAHVYMQRYFPKDNKEIIDGIFTAVKDIIERKLRSDEYNLEITYEVTKKFLRQLNNADVIIGYPDWLANETIVSKFYDRHFPISELYYANQIKFVEILLKNKLRSFYDYSVPIFDYTIGIFNFYVKSYSSPKTFLKSFTQESIEFSRDFKQIIFPPRVFSENTYKFLSAQLFDPINYGAAGTNIASKIYLEWLRRITYARYAPKCVLHQMPSDLDKRRADEYLLKATSYLLGLRTAYEAWPTKDSYPIHFQKFGAITDYRVFFLSFAESMCRTPVAREEIKPYAFINFVASNAIEFTEAFQCYKRHAMNRQYKCNPLKRSL